MGESELNRHRAKDTIWSVPYVILMATNFFQSMAAFMSNTTLPLFAQSLGATTATVGGIASAFYVTALLIRPFAGPAFDSFSRKKMLLASQAIIALALFLYGVVESIPALVAVRLLHGIGVGCGGPLAMSLVSEYLPTTKFASGISIYTLAQSFAQVIGPASGLYLVDAVGFPSAYFLSCGSVVIAMMGVFAIKEPQRKKLPYEFRVSRMFAKEAVGKAGALMLLTISFSCVTSYVVLYGYERGVQEMGIYFIVYATCLLLTRPIFGNLADRLGSPPMLAVGVVFFASSFLALSQAVDLPGFLLAAVLGSAGFGCCGPLLQSMTLASVPMERRGAASNTTFTGLDAGQLIGPVVGGALVDLLAPSLGGQAAAFSQMWVAMLVPTIGTFAIALFWCFRKGRR